MDCTCNGNPNCFNCSGTGIYQKPKKLNAVNLTHKETDKLALQKPSFEQLFRSARRIPCPHCENFVSKHKYLQHVKHDCVQKWKNVKNDEKVLKLLFNEGFYSCPNCLLLIRKKANLDFHVKQGCPTYFINKGKNKKVKMGNKKKSKKQKTQTINKAHLEKGLNNCPNPGKETDERQFDGSKGYHILRENGRFGSHSTHDDYGEEAYL